MQTPERSPHAPRTPPPPKLSTAQWVTRVVGLVIAACVLTWAWRAAEVNPGAFWTKDGSLVEFLFGKRLSEAQREEARAEAVRQIELRQLNDARAVVARERTEAGQPALARAELDDAARARLPEVRRRAGPEALERELAQRTASAIDARRGGFFPPDLSPDNLRRYTEALLETIAIAVWGTVLAVIAALPASLLAARRTLGVIAPGESASHKGVRWVALQIVRRFFDATRGFNEYVLALILVALIGLGPFAGVLALALHTFGVLGKVFSEAIEASEQGPIDGVAATGAGGLQVVSFAVIPQVMPFVVSQTLLRFESNVRSAAILGVCGAGGIGMLLQSKIQSYQYREVCTMMILIIIVVTLIDAGCSRAMRRLL